MVVVANNVLSSLAKIERLGTLDDVLEDIATTVSVLQELLRVKRLYCENHVER